MKFFFDTEFIEDGKTIDLISIGIVDESGRSYYACNDECDLSKASDWVKQNVFPSLPSKYSGINPGNPDISPQMREEILTWKTRDRIAADILNFVFQGSEQQDQASQGHIEVEFWADYAAYDWVALCQLFGPMVDLPSGFPMFCSDIQQLKRSIGFAGSLPEIPPEAQHNALADAYNCLERYQFLMGQK